MVRAKFNIFNRDEDISDGDLVRQELEKEGFKVVSVTPSYEGSFDVEVEGDEDLVAALEEIGVPMIDVDVTRID